MVGLGVALGRRVMLHKVRSFGPSFFFFQMMMMMGEECSYASLRWLFLIELTAWMLIRLLFGYVNGSCPMEG